jgi:hypothetical protein
MGHVKLLNLDKMSCRLCMICYLCTELEQRLSHKVPHRW